ncbi:hypothetical protein B0H16DRAFT_1785363 [Mycena metata]|uniref:SMP-30/Gluconolactonase/LRE-like region domain-containing protein n=1 Tax=Mycena metata TaxID=1033252 RepID=A0AAD7NNN1_9AGAR|nr:hypothetical protein B0H16DRAFT_1785363 [Mycena metata]
MATSNHTVAGIFQFSEKTFIENLLVLPNGHLLLTTFASGDLFILNPNAAEPKAETLVSLPGSTALSGIAPLGGDLMKLYVVSAVTTADSTTGTLFGDPIPVPDTRIMNGMTVLPNRPHTILSADSGGRIMRVDTDTRKVDVAFADDALAPPSDAKLPIGVNGIDVRGGYLYFTNSTRGTFARFPVDDDGNKTGSVEILVQRDVPVAGLENALDDFTFDTQGNVYAAVHPTTVVKITPEGEESAFARGGTTTTFNQPTSVALAKDGDSIYVATGGGQVIQVKL